MTYGEAHVAEKESLTLVAGKWEQSVRFKIKPKRMSKENAVKYYNKKLFTYWLSGFDEKVNIKHKKKILSALMFGNTDAFNKKIKEDSVSVLKQS